MPDGEFECAGGHRLTPAELVYTVDGWNVWAVDGSGVLVLVVDPEAAIEELGQALEELEDVQEFGNSDYAGALAFGKALDAFGAYAEEFCVGVAP